MRWSADDDHGVEIWGFSSPIDSVDYDPPIRLANPLMLPLSSASTVSGGLTWEARFLGHDTCPVTWTSEWDDRCIHIRLDDGSNGSPIAGDYWAITQYNVVAFRLSDDSGTWQLDYATYNP